MLAPFIETFVADIDRAFKQVQDTFGGFEDLEFDLRADRLQDELSCTENGIGMFFAIDLHGTFQQKIQCILQTTFPWDDKSFGIGTIFKDVSPVFGTGATIRKFAVSKVRREHRRSL